MTTLDNIIGVTISIEDAAVTQQGFGTAMIAVHHTLTSRPRVEEFTSLSAMVAAGHSSSSMAYQAAQVLFSQSPRVDSVKIGRRDSQPTQVLNITPSVVAVADRLGEESLSETNFATHTKWDVTGDGSDSGGNFTHTHAAGVSTLTQTAANLAQAGLPSRWYRLNYTVSGVAGTVAANITTAFALTSTPLTLVNGVQTTYFKSAVVPGNFVISATSSSGGSFTLDDMSLMTLEDATYEIDVEGQTASIVEGGLIDTVLTNLAAAIEGLTGSAVTATSVDGTHISVTAPAGVLYNFGNASSNLLVQDVSADAGLEDDLDAILLADPDWFGLGLDSNSPAEVMVAAAWAQANDKMFFTELSDSDILDPVVTNDPLSQLQALGYHNTIVIVRKSVGKEWAGVGWMGVGFAYEPGQITWAHKQIAGVATETFTETEMNTIVDKGGNYYIERYSVGDILEGVSVSGRYIDITHGAFWLKARLQEYLFQLLVSTRKVPFTDAGLSLIEGKIWEVIDLGVRNDFIAEQPKATVFIPKAIDVSTTDKAARTLTGVVINATLAGAIHRIQMEVTLSL